MRTELVSIATDTVPLDAAFYMPEGRETRGGVLLMHGNQMNFYVGAPRFLPPHLAELGYACLAFNRRGHDTLSTRDSREPVGGAFQTVAESLADNEYAAGFLAARGFRDPIVIGHSNGGMLGAQFTAAHPETRALVLLSAHSGRTMQLNPPPFLGQHRHEEFVERAHALVAAGHGRELMLVPGWWHAITAESYLDRTLNTPDTLAAAEKVRCPTLFIRGDAESPINYPADAFQARCPAPCELKVVENCDHFYVGREDKIADLVVDWLTRTLG